MRLLKRSSHCPYLSHFAANAWKHEPWRSSGERSCRRCHRQNEGPRGEALRPPPEYPGCGGGWGVKPTRPQGCITTFRAPGPYPLGAWGGASFIKILQSRFMTVGLKKNIIFDLKSSIFFVWFQKKWTYFYGPQKYCRPQVLCLMNKSVLKCGQHPVRWLAGVGRVRKGLCVANDSAYGKVWLP